MATDEFDLVQDNDSLNELFERAAAHLPSILPQDNQRLLTLYAYYKQGAEGPCTTAKPSWYDLKAKSKWEAWNKLGKMSQIEAKNLYIQEIRNMDSNFDSTKTSTNAWVRVSTMPNPDTDPVSLVDYVKDGDSAKVLKELQKLKNINHVDEEGLGLIHWAADRGNVSILKSLLDHGADVNLIDSGGQSALHYAASCGHLECVRLLLDRGASPNLQDSDGCRAKDLADDQLVKELLLCHTY